jgi:hypothetical protein
MNTHAIRIGLVALAAAAALAAATGAGAKPKVGCTVEPFTYDQATGYIGGDTGTHELRYVATGTATLTGEVCPLNGRMIRIREAGIYSANLGDNVAGRYAAQWDIDGDGEYDDAIWHGRIRGISRQAPGDWNEVVVASFTQTDTSGSSDISASKSLAKKLTLVRNVMLSSLPGGSAAPIDMVISVSAGVVEPR